MAKETDLQRHERALNTGRLVSKSVLGNKVRLIAHPAMNPSQFREHAIPREYSPDWDKISSTDSFNKNRDFPSMVESVKKEGVKTPVVLVPWNREHPNYPKAQGIVFDGHHRIAAALQAGVDIPFYTIHPDDEPFWKTEYDNGR